MIGSPEMPKRLGKRMSGKRPVLIKDVAAKAGVSMTTVSHVLNDVPGKRISDETREQVRAAASELGYQPNGLARNFRLQRSHTLALVSDEIATTPHAGRIILGAHEAASKRGWLLMLVNTGGDPECEAREIDALMQRRVDGFLYATMYHQDVTLPAALVDVPTVLLDAKTADPSVSWVVPDEVAGGRTATEHLLSHGHRRIGFLNNVDDIPATRGRLEGFLGALADAGVEVRQDWIRTGSSDTQGGMDAGRAILESDDRPTALFCFTDRMAMGVYHLATELGLRIPEDLSIVGFDNQELIADGLRPGLTTVALPHYEMGAFAVERLIDLIEQPKKGEPVQARLACPLVERASVSRPSGGS
jgi:LacI family transcriptional regulator